MLARSGGYFMKTKNLSRGFTLIELLIVVALLGALAVGLIGALDPLEQLKKGTDTGSRDTVSQIHQAVLRFYSVKGYFPWCDVGGTNCVDPSASSLSDAAVSALETSGELKANFKNLQKANLAKTLLTADSVTGTVIACYYPTSKAFRADPNTKYDNTGVMVEPATSCEGNGGQVACFWCVQ